MKNLNIFLLITTLLLFLLHGYASWDAAKDADYVKAIYFQIGFIVFAIFQIYLEVMNK